MPFGAWNLWPDTLSMSMFMSRSLNGIFPAAWTASVWKSAPARCASSARASTGYRLPVSLFAHITETTAVSSSIISRARSMSRRPRLSTGIFTTV